MRRTFNNPHELPAFGPAVTEAQRLGLKVGVGYGLGNTEIGLDLTTPTGETFTVELHAKNWQHGGRTVREKAKQFGVTVPDSAKESPGEAIPEVPRQQPSQPTP